MEDAKYSLNRKEYMLQLLEKKNKDMEKMLTERSADDSWIKNRLKAMGIDDTQNDLTISNVIEENEQLKSQIKMLETGISSSEKNLSVSKLPEEDDSK